MSTENQVIPFDINTVRLTPNDLTPHLIGGRCTRCGKHFFPKREVCPLCFDQSGIEEIFLNAHGTVISYTVIRKASDRVVPYAVAYVMTLDGLIVFAPLTGGDIEQFHVGMDVECVFNKREEADGQRMVAYEFSPVQRPDGEGEEK
jgi:uncharacterized OB-fold protein